MIKKLLGKYKARNLEAKVNEMKRQQELEYATYALKLRMERMLAQPANSKIAA